MWTTSTSIIDLTLILSHKLHLLGVCKCETSVLFFKVLKKYRRDILGKGTSCSIHQLFCLPLSLVEVGRSIRIHTRGLPIR